MKDMLEKLNRAEQDRCKPLTTGWKSQIAGPSMCVCMSVWRRDRERNNDNDRKPFKVTNKLLPPIQWTPPTCSTLQLETDTMTNFSFILSMFSIAADGKESAAI